MRGLFFVLFIVLSAVKCADSSASSSFETGIYSPARREEQQKYWEDRWSSPAKSTVYGMLRVFSAIGESFEKSMNKVSDKIVNRIRFYIEEFMEKHRRVQQMHRKVMPTVMTANNDNQRRNYQGDPPFRTIEETRNTSNSRNLEPVFIDDSPLSSLDSPSFKMPADGIVTFAYNESCKRGSKLILIQQTTYICNDKIVTEDWYKSLNDSQRASQKCKNPILKVEACLCSQDLYGKFCEQETSVSCKPEILNKPNCPIMNEFLYVSNYPGLPPCFYINKHSTLSFTVKLQCIIQIYDGPHVDFVNSDYKIIFNEKPPSASNPWTPFAGFTYEIEQSTIKATRTRKLTPQVKFVNWNDLGKSVKYNYGKKYNLTLNQLTGLTPFEIDLDFSRLPEGITTAGRYTVEFNIVEQFNVGNDTTVPSEMNASSVQMMVFEDSSYTEPQKAKAILTTMWIIFIVFIAACLTGYFTYKWRVILKLKKILMQLPKDNSCIQNKKPTIEASQFQKSFVVQHNNGFNSRSMRGLIETEEKPQGSINFHKEIFKREIQSPSGLKHSDQENCQPNLQNQSQLRFSSLPYPQDDQIRFPSQQKLSFVDEADSYTAKWQSNRNHYTHPTIIRIPLPNQSQQSLEDEPQSREVADSKKSLRAELNQISFFDKLNFSFTHQMHNKIEVLPQQSLQEVELNQTLSPEYKPPSVQIQQIQQIEQYICPKGESSQLTFPSNSKPMRAEVESHPSLLLFSQINPEIEEEPIRPGIQDLLQKNLGLSQPNPESICHSSFALSEPNPDSIWQPSQSVSQQITGGQLWQSQKKGLQRSPGQQFETSPESELKPITGTDHQPSPQGEIQPSPEYEFKPNLVGVPQPSPEGEQHICPEGESQLSSEQQQRTLIESQPSADYQSNLNSEAELEPNYIQFSAEPSLMDVPPTEFATKTLHSLDDQSRLSVNKKNIKQVNFEKQQ